jgi:CRP-like cAMP-binding protein/tRNA A-37 threonylcarbamoyl transferase component Bud32
MLIPCLLPLFISFLQPSNDNSRTNGTAQDMQTETPAVEREKNINVHARVRQQRGQNIFAQKIDLTEDFETPRYPKSDTAIQFIDTSLVDNFIFASLSLKERRLLIDAMVMETLPAGTVIIKQGEVGDFFYVVDEGHVSFAVDGNHVGACGRGGSFGELALLYNCPRAATCLANTTCRVWKVDQRTFRHMLANNTASQQKDIHDVLRKVPFLSELDESNMLRISDALTSVTFPEGERIINKGDVGEVFYILREGKVKVHDIGFGDSKYVDQEIGPGDWFGERALLTGDARSAHVTAITNCTTLCLSRETFEKVLGPLQGLIDHAMKKRTLEAVPIFAMSQFQPFEMARLTDLLIERSFPAGTVLAEEGKPHEQNLYIIREGRVVIATSNGIINTLMDADYFGENWLKDEPGSPSKQTITVQADTECGVLTRRDIESVIGKINRLGQPINSLHNALNKSIRYKDLVKFRILGVGTFGKVWLVSHKRTGTPYALKQLNKREIIGHHQVEGVIREKNIRASIEHPFVVNLVATFQDDRHLFMLIELVQGGELFSVIHTETRDGIPNGNSRFYAACILESLSHLHYRGICYRDLKPENILIDGKGYCVLVDLGFAKVVSDKTYTLCGTPEYLAPEIILSKGHDKGVDYWAFGVLIYEMLVGRSPFYSYGTDQVSLFKRIVQVKYSFPPGGMVSEPAQDLIQRLVVRRQANRFGCLARGDMDIRDHYWFNVIDVDKLLLKHIPAPWVPRIKDPLDASHFDSYRHVENEPPTNKPHLSATQQTLFKEF